MTEGEKQNHTPIRNETTQTFETLPLENGYYRWSSKGREEEEPIDIFFKQEAFQKAWDRCYNNQFTPPQAQQTGGVLLGQVEQIGNGYKIYIEKVEEQLMEGEGSRTIPSTESWEPSERQKVKVSNLLKYNKNYRGLYEIGFFHGHVDNIHITYFIEEDDRRLLTQYQKPWQIALIFQVLQEKGAFIHREKTKEGYSIKYPYEAFVIPTEYQYGKVKGKGFRPIQNHPQSKPLSPTPDRTTSLKNEIPSSNFSQFTPENVKEKGYEKVMEEYKVEFGRLIDTDSRLEPFRSHITTYTDLAIQVVGHIKDYFQQRNILVTPERIKEIHSNLLKKGFDKAENFPLKGDDDQTKYAREKLISALSAICDIEEMNSIVKKP